jgi:hypothetical protein
LFGQLRYFPVARGDFTVINTSHHRLSSWGREKKRNVTKRLSTDSEPAYTAREDEI